MLDLALTFVLAAALIWKVHSETSLVIRQITTDSVRRQMY